MKIKTYPLSLFNDTNPSSDIHSILVPQGSQFLCAKVLHDGVYCWYAVPEEIQDNHTQERFVIMKPDRSIPDNADFVTVLDTIIEVGQPEGGAPPKQAILVLPVYKLK